MRDGRRVPTPGGDVQAQTNVQVLLNILVWGMDLQEAVEAPLHDALHEALEDRGYEVERVDRWDHVLGGAGIVRRQPGGRVQAGADPHESTTAFVR
ncbi:hypothetical protein G6553_07985 [Nocardioides sp. IC4_145]|uniref:gamma-glutamyltransferase n=1 Tax=Nocardioides sp. IC4_145 TaxID=2714037 RepID=UPI00140D85E7|nr:hypothetical protein [Nocardioides sp. IC4_145]